MTSDSRLRENPVSRRVLDASGRRLVYIGERATPDLWDRLWSLDEEGVALATSPTREGRNLVRLTSRFVSPSEGLIVEGGCGRGQFVAALHRAGYSVLGVDFATSTVAALNRHAPHLDVRVGDLRCLPMKDESAAAFWSLGVIEHFWEGYEDLASEMSRVVKDGGYLFCAFPYMNPLRRLKARLGLYDRIEEESEPEGFYQFALSARETIQNLSRFGFEFVTSRRSSGLMGVLGELGPASAPLEHLYHYAGESIFTRGLRKIVNDVLSSLGCSHSVLLVLRRRPRELYKSAP